MREARSAHRSAMAQVQRSALVAICCFLIGLAGCGSPVPAPFLPGAAPWRSGEASTYQVTNVEGRYAGTARYAIGQSSRPETAGGWSVTREIAAGGETEISSIEITAGDYRPRYSTMMRINTAQQRETVETTIAGGQVDITLVSAKDVMSVERVNVPSDIRDERTLLLVARTLPLAKGYSTRLNSFLPVVGKMNRVTLRVLDSALVTVPAGTFDSWLLELTTEDGRVTRAWIGTVAPFPLVRYVDGRSRATYDLSEFQPG